MRSAIAAPHLPRGPARAGANRTSLPDIGQRQRRRDTVLSQARIGDRF
jgi:hypothetical protein